MKTHYLTPLITCFVLLSIWTSGCAPTTSERFNQTGKRPLQAIEFYRQLDHLVEQEGVKTALGHSIPNFPYLRTNRLLSELALRPLSRKQKQTLYAYLREQDLEARRSEILNLTPTARQFIAETLGKSDGSAAALTQQLEQFSLDLLSIDQKDPGFYTAITEAIEVPSDYSTTMRVLGLYPLFYLPVTYFTSRAYDRIGEWHETPIEDLKIFGKEVSYRSAPTQKGTFQKIQALLSTAPKDAFGFLQLSQEAQEKVLHYYAPIYTQDQVGEYDKIGKMMWKDGELQLDFEIPTVYYYFNPTWVDNKPALQINYVTWYSARDGDLTPWFEVGKLDGFNYRVTIDNKGNPITADVVYNCGCYHFYIPNRDRIHSIIPAFLEFDAMVVDYLPPSYPEKRLNMKINTGWHQVERVGDMPPKEDQKIYTFTPYKALEALPYLPNQRKSMFDAQGIVIGSERVEPYLLFSMGIPEIGAMRQRGHQPTKLIGRAQFSDPKLLNKNFIFNPLNHKGKETSETSPLPPNHSVED